MTKEKFKKAIDVIGLPRLIVFCFFVAIVLTAYFNDIDVPSYFSSTIKYWGMWAVAIITVVSGVDYVAKNKKVFADVK